MTFCSFVLAAAPIVSVGLYQEDVAVVTRAVTPVNGLALVRVGAHEPFGGSFWHSSKAPLKVRRFEGERNVSVAFRAPAYLRGVIEKAKAEGGHRVRISDDNLYEKEVWQVFSVSGKIRGNVSDLIELASGSYVDVANGLVVSVDGLAPEDCKFDSADDDYGFWEFAGADAPFTAEYLTDGARWTPSYRLALAGEKATLFMSGELINDLGDWNETEVSLISGKCTVARDERPKGFGSFKRKMENDSYDVRMCAAAGALPADGYRSAADVGSDDDAHYRSLGKVSLKRGESMSVPLGAEKTDVKRLVEWTAAGLWDAVKFRNPFKFPMAAGKVEVVEDGCVLGMPKCEWTNAGDETFVKIAEAKSVKGSFEEQRERKGASKIGSFGGETMKVGNRTYYKDKVTATFKVTNFRGEKASLSVKRTFSGELGEMTLDPTKVKDIPPRDFGVNLDHELTWEFDLNAGETREFRVEYARWFAM